MYLSISLNYLNVIKISFKESLMDKRKLDFNNEKDKDKFNAELKEKYEEMFDEEIYPEIPK